MPEPTPVPGVFDRSTSGRVPQVVTAARDPYLSGMKNLELSDDETVALINALKRAFVTDRYPLPPRVRTLVGILQKLRPEPPRPAASPAPKVYEPPSKGRYRRRG